MVDLIKLVRFLIEKYIFFSSEWNKRNSVVFNMEKNKVCHVQNNLDIMNYLYTYRSFLIDMINLHLNFENLNLHSMIESRVKQINSIEDKLSRYMDAKHSFGEIPLKKCLNDIFGCRILMDADYEYEDICLNLKKYFSNIKIISRKLGDYNAVHAYFIVGNNQNFIWELQIWNRSFIESNYNSHHKEKQNYTNWEGEK